MFNIGIKSLSFKSDRFCRSGYKAQAYLAVKTIDKNYYSRTNFLHDGIENIWSFGQDQIVVSGNTQTLFNLEMWDYNTLTLIAEFPIFKNDLEVTSSTYKQNI